jgi:hypothetical protein
MRHAAADGHDQISGDNGFANHAVEDAVDARESDLRLGRERQDRRPLIAVAPLGLRTG